MKKRRGSKRHKSAPKRKRARSRSAPQVVVVAENPRKGTMAKARRRKRRHGKKRNPAHARPATHRRRRRRHHAKNPARRRHHRRRRNPGGPLVDMMLAIGVGGLVAIGGNIAQKELSTRLPTTTPTWAIDAARVAAGVGLGVALKKHGPIAAGAAVGLAAPSLVNLIKPLLPDSMQGIVMLPDSYGGGGTIEAIASEVRRLGNRVDAISAIDMAAIDMAAIDNGF